jgi:hypothetical protein
MGNSYNDIWTREKFLEYRKLKREGYSHDMLKKHFGDDIKHSGLYNENTNILPWLDFLKEIIVTPKYTNYNIEKVKSDIYKDKNDYKIEFDDNKTEYIIYLFFYTINNIDTYNILLTTKEQWLDYINKLNQYKTKGFITNDEFIELVSIVEKETGYNQIYSILKKVSYILSEVIKNELKYYPLSLGDTNNKVKINLYRNIIKNSFKNLIESEEIINNKKYFIYYNK